MKISTRLKIAALVPTLMAVIIGSALLFSYSSVRKAQANIKTAGNIVSNTNELSSLTTEYILYREDRPKQQFLEVHDSIMRLAAIRFRNPEQQQLLDTIVGNSESVEGLFHKLVSNYDLSSPDKSDVVLREAEQRLAGQLILRLRQVAADAARLQMLTQDEISATQTRTNGIIVFVIVISALPLTFVLSRTRRNITSSLTTFRRGTEVIASGNLTHRIGIVARDEIGELSRAFDIMTEQLRNITVSRDELSREIEERKRAEAALLEQREWLRVTLTSIGDAVIATDTFGLVTFLNPVAGELTGWQSEEATGQPIQSVFRIINEQTRQTAENVVERVLREGNIVNLANHTALITRDGREIPIEDSAAPIRDKDGELSGVVLVFHDTTERRRAQEALRESQQKNEFLADIIKLGSQPFGVGYPDGRLGLINSAFEHLTGYSSDELQSIDWTTVLTPPEWQQIERFKLDELHRTGKAVRYEKEYIRKDGSRVPIELLVHLVTDLDGVPQYYYSFLTDITERKRAEEELRQSQAELEFRVNERTTELRVSNKALIEYAAKLERLNGELQEFAFVASHDLQEPLRKIQTFGKMLEKKYRENLGEHGQDYLFRMTKSAKRMSDLLHSLLDYSRVATQPSPFELVELAEVAREAVSDLELAINRAGGTVEIGDLPQIDGDAAQIRQLLQNLIANSMKYCKDSEKPVVRIHGDTSGTICTISVEDNGIGFEEEHIDRIFKPFQQLHGRNEYDGTGMGLAICRKIVERHEGSITAKSSPGQGAIFIVQLPIKQREREAEQWRILPIHA